MNTDDLNKCLRDELSAIETYRQALEKARGQDGRDDEFQQLSGILQDHERAASQVRTLVEQMGATPSQDSGAWGTWSKAVMGTAKLFGDTAALKALKEGEESGVKDYRSVTQDGETPATVRQAIATIVTKNEEHIRTLDQLMAKV
jgi:bacterioferritin (cytochrome b1)